MDKPSKKKTHFDKYDVKKAELKGSKSNADVVVISPSEKHFQKEQEKLAIASENEVSCWPRSKHTKNKFGRKWELF